MIGIDLGTSNTCAALWNESDQAVNPVEISQLYGPGKLVEQCLFPSMLYIARDEEVTSGATRLAWDSDQNIPSFAVGEIARQRASETPDRVIASSKSWLCNRSIDRRAQVLPWGAQGGQMYSPLEVTSNLLSHVRQSLLNTGVIATADLQRGVVVTVPASFDDVARSLTSEAAQEAGFERVTLLEEPLAAMYAWIAAHEHTWREKLEPGDCVLVCDVGGGTADFSLIQVSEHHGELVLERISVGDHILLGGDNMDLALAYAVRRELSERGTEIDHWQFLSLVHSVRNAKELLLAGQQTDSIPISIASSGANLFASTISTELNRTQVEAIVVEGFVPLCGADERPMDSAIGGFQEFGLPYASDAALSRHLAAFLARSRRNLLSNSDSQEQYAGQLAAHDTLLLPTAILFNGGVFNAPILKERVVQLIQGWSQQPLRELEGGQLDLAVCRGAAYYGYLKEAGQGIRIRSGTSRSYYLGVEQSMPAVPGFRPPVKGVCVVPQGMEEGTEEVLPGKEFGLRPGQRARFRFFCSKIRAGDTPGVIVEKAERDLEELSALDISIPESDDLAEIVPVTLLSRMTELGNLELWMEHVQSKHRWKLEFDVRAQER